MSRPRVLLTRQDLPDGTVDRLRQHFQLDVWAHPRPIERKELLDCVKGVEGIFCMVTEKIDAEVLDQAGPQLKVVATLSVGYDHLDVAEIKKRGIRIGYTPGVLTGATAEIAMALILAVTRRIFTSSAALNDGTWSQCAWSPLWMCSDGLEGATVGIIGLGRIGLAVARRLRPFDVQRIVYAGRRPSPDADQVGAELVPLDDLLRQSDVVVITCSLTETTRGLIDAAALAKMKPTAVLVNTSRGAIVDQDALVDALRAGRIAAAGLDVMTPEPLPAGHPLTQLPNCVLLPHVGSATFRTRKAMADMTVDNLVTGLRGDAMPAELL